jgi:hypothetical protein
MPNVMTPNGFQFQKLVQLADSHVTIPQQLKPERKRKFRMKRTTLPHPAATGNSCFQVPLSSFLIQFIVHLK